MKQTAVDYLAEKYNYITWLRNRDEVSAGKADKMRADAYEQAKEMEKEQIMAAYNNCELCDPEEYYNKTFKQEK